MTITKESFVDLQEKYDKVIKLLEEDSKLDPETEPFVSKYSARQILIGMKANIENLIRNQLSDEENFKLIAMLGTVYLYLGIVSIDTEDTSTGEKQLEKCKETLEKYQSKPEVILIILNMYNQFGIIWFRKNPENAKVHLEKSEDLYKKFKAQSLPPVDIADLFHANLESYNTQMAYKNLEKIHTFTLYYLAQVFGALKDALKSSVYCHVTLQRQLDMFEDYDPIDWSLNSATLSQFFMEKNGFKQARHHLAASSCVLDKYEKELNETTEKNEAHEATLETFRHRSADVARCWAKYSLLLLAKSKERLLSQTDDLNTHCSLSSDLSKLQLSTDSTISAEDLQHLDFEGIAVESYEYQVTDQFVLILEDARKVFLNGQQWLFKAQEYYTLDSLASDYIEIELDQTQLYLLLLFFDDNPDNQAKLHKRRVTLLENILDKVNPQYYLSYCRQVWFELGRTYSDILDIKADKLKEIQGHPSPHALSKINKLVEKSICHFNNYVHSFRDKSTNVLPEKFQEDCVKPVLQAYFHLGALYSRYITLDKQKQLQNVEASLEHYKFVTSYCDKNSKAKEFVLTEYGICKEMVLLLPVKILRLKTQ